MDNHIERGKQAETAASRFLAARGYRIVAQNWRHQHLEVDIVAYDGNTLVFVEVKMRSSTAFGMPYEAVSATKQEKLRRAAELYIETQQYDGEIRFDVVSVLRFGQSPPQCRLIKDAFWPE